MWRQAVDRLPAGRSAEARPSNARQHSAKQIRQIAKSIETFGFNVPVLIEADGKVIAGHGRLLAAKRLGWTEIPTISRSIIYRSSSRRKRS